MIGVRREDRNDQVPDGNADTVLYCVCVRQRWRIVVVIKENKFKGLLVRKANLSRYDINQIRCIFCGATTEDKCQYDIANCESCLYNNKHIERFIEFLDGINAI